MAENENIAIFKTEINQLFFYANYTNNHTVNSVKDVAASGTKITLPLKADDFLQQYYMKLFYIWQALLSKEHFKKYYQFVHSLGIKPVTLVLLAHSSSTQV